MKTDKTNSNTTSVTMHPLLEALLSQRVKLDAEEVQIHSMPTPACQDALKSNSLASKKYSSNGTVDPIKDQIQIEAAKQYFLNQPQRYKNNPTNVRNYALFVFTINCARRIGDVLQLKIEDILNDDMSFRYYIGKNQSVGIIEQKTKKSIRIPINDEAKEALHLYFDTLPNIDLSSPLFISRETKDINKAQSEYDEALCIGDRNQIKYKKQRLDIAIHFTNTLEPRSVSKIIKDMSKEIGLDKDGLNINTHSMRKTCVHRIYELTKDLELCRIILNHSKLETTRRYLGINQDEINTAIMAVHQ